MSHSITKLSDPILHLINTKSKIYTEAKSKEKHGVWDPMPELTITSPYVYFRLQHIYYGQPYAIVELNPMPESTLDWSGHKVRL